MDDKELLRLNRGLKSRTPFSNTLRNDLLMQLKQIHEDTDVPMSKLLDKAVEMLIKEYHLKQRL
jgi:hypothetical protein